MIKILIIAALAAFTPVHTPGLTPGSAWLVGPTALNSDNYYQHVDSPGIAVVEFWAPWNAIEMIQSFQRLEGAKLYRVNIESNAKLIKELEIESIPAVIIYKDGEEVFRYQAGIRFKGDLKAENIQQIIDKLNG